MNILAIDQSLCCSGVAFLNENEPNSFGMTTIEPGKLRDEARLLSIRTDLDTLVESNAINLVIMESYAFGQGSSAYSLGELGGLIKMYCLDKDLPLFVMPIQTHKMFTTGKGNTKKDLMLKEVYKRYQIDITNDNVADAVSILKTFLGYLDWVRSNRTDGNYTKPQLKAIAKIDTLIKEREEAYKLL